MIPYLSADLPPVWRQSSINSLSAALPLYGPFSSWRISMLPIDPVKRSLLRISSLALLLLLVGCGFSPSATNGPTPAKSSPTPLSATNVIYSPLFTTHYLVSLRPDVAYGPDPLETLDLCMPSGAKGSLPGVVLMHGGSSDTGDKRAEYDTLGDDLQSAYMGLASQGFVVA